MQIQVLLNTQRDALLEAIKTSSLKPKNFNLEEETRHSTATISHVEDESTFKIEYSKKQSSIPYTVEFMPGDKDACDREERIGWDRVSDLFSKWLTYIERESKAGKPWPSEKESAKAA